MVLNYLELQSISGSGVSEDLELQNRLGPESVDAESLASEILRVCGSRVMETLGFWNN